MKNKRSTSKDRPLKPLDPILFVGEKGSTLIAPNSIQADVVGEKAFGLSCLPRAWRLPFLVVSKNLLFSYANFRSKKNQKSLVDNWAKEIVKALDGIIDSKTQEKIIIRSSGFTEGLEERGKYYSFPGVFHELPQLLTHCLKTLVADKNLKKYEIPLIIQKYIIPISAKGHLSNERRCYEEPRDWLGEFENVKKNINKPFQINLRNWRKKVVVETYIDKPLICNLSAHVKEMLEIPAAWACERGLRLHFEWVWDGKTIYIVQADQDCETNGVDPNKILYSKLNSIDKFVPKILKEITDEHTKRFNKIKNVFTYKKLGLAITKLYVLDDQTIINDLASGKISSSLRSDIQALVKGSLVIRTDIASDDINKRQMLPRTEEMRDADIALNWLKEKSTEIKKSSILEDVVFIFHNFIPALASAFAFAAPGQRKVQIEALWGLPEGLYFNSHDKYIVDTKTRREEDLIKTKIDGFSVIAKKNFKHFFVAPDETGHWGLKILKSPYDWRGTIQKEEWVKEIAFESRRIAAEEGKSLSVMWLIGVSIDEIQRKIFPWYHEPIDQRRMNRALTQRTKTPFDKTLNIKTSEDIEELRRETNKRQPTVRRVRIQLLEEKLLRNKNTLRIIGEECQKIGAVIVLEGGVLSHAYYQLMETNAIVEVVHPFSDSEDKREFNKLVRDKVSSNIEHGGEIVNTAKLSGESFLRALREKLIEEAFEVLDAIDKDSIVGELADINEVIDGILKQIDSNRDELEQKQKQKKERAGGFSEGIILLDTVNPLPSMTEQDSNETLFDVGDNMNIQKRPPVDKRALSELAHKIEKWTDKRQHLSAIENILHLEIPMTLDDWTASTSESSIDLDSESDVRAKISGKRFGSKFEIKLSIFIPPKQLEMFDVANSVQKLERAKTKKVFLENKKRKR